MGSGYARRAVAILNGLDLSDELTVGIILAALTAACAFAFNQAAAARDRRRTLYSEAYQTALEWVELVYRVRRRQRGQEDELIDRYNHLHARIKYFQGWLHTESPALGRSYRSFSQAVRDESMQLIEKAWTQHPDSALGQFDVRTHPTADKPLRAQFLRDATDSLSFNPLVRAAVKWRHRDAYQRGFWAWISRLVGGGYYEYQGPELGSTDEADLPASGSKGLT